MRNSKKFKFLGKFFSARNLASIDQPAGRIPARGLTVRPTRNQRGFPRQPAVDLPLADNARNVPSDDFDLGFSLPRQTSACRCRGSPRPPNAPRRRFTRFHTSRAPDCAPARRQSSPRPRSGPRSIAARADPRWAQSSWVYTAPRHLNVS